MTQQKRPDIPHNPVGRASRPPSRGGMAAHLLAAAAALLAGNLAVPAGAQTSSGTLLAPLSAPDELAVQQWGQRLLILIDTGQPAADAAAFTFANPALNGPLFSPVMARCAA